MNSIRTSFTTISLLVLLIFSCIAYVANAQTSTEPTPAERFQELQAERSVNQTERASSSEVRATTRTEALAERQAERSERQAALSDRQQERVRNLAANISNRMETAIMRLSDIGNRLAVRADIMASEGLVVTEAETQLVVATTALEAARANLMNIDAEVGNFVSSANPREAWSTVRASYTATKTDLSSAREALRSSLTQLRNASLAETAPDSTETTDATEAPLPVEETEAVTE